VYVEAGVGNDPVRLEVVLFGTPGGNMGSRRWRLRVTHLTPRDAPLAAPSHCLQFFTARSGIVQSFNYAGTGGYTVSIVPLFYLFEFYYTNKALNKNKNDKGTPQIILSLAQHY
jgi:hypothetical protein